jgi:Domain of unknown function (DUF1707)
MTNREVQTAMPQNSPPWTQGPGGPGNRRFRYGNADYRASDAERAEIADRLSKHYQDGRLDQAEFNERLDRAMNAKNRSEFHGLFADLPELPDQQADTQKGKKAQFGPTGPAGGFPMRIGPQGQCRSVLSQLLFIAVIVLAVVILAHALTHAFLPWILLAGLGFVLLRIDRNRRRG